MVSHKGIFFVVDLEERIGHGYVYQRYPTIQDILLVDSRRRSVKHYRRVGPYKWEEYLYECDDDMIELTSIDVSLRVQDIYFHVYLELEEKP